MTETEAVVVLTTVASPDDAHSLVRGLLERRLIACGTILPSARSLYRWEGKILDEQETVILVKTREALVGELKEAFAEMHPYQVPELLALPVTAGMKKYLDWLQLETAKL
ncbi:MAG: divalent-cation tolerance protein CutA [Anaerolineae bacterium]|nr:divalent-cation tolerance protein CutA [Gemmatimonadaceae bacterium]